VLNRYTSEMVDQLRIAVVGAGRLGNALARAFRAGGLNVDGPLGRGANGDGSDVVLLCVPDGEIASAAAALRTGTIVGHTSGATSLDALAPHEAFSLHPLVSVSIEGGTFAGAACAVAGTTERARSIASDLGRAAGMRPFAVADADRALYHAAASMAANYLVTLEGAAERLFDLCGVRREDSEPLVRSAVDNWARLGAHAALTGPVARGDHGTVAR
jgi:predicted short-subunit dehydrogenase-like oxidoreductase (DUF2520 family)